jgi:hypothetical protein
MLSLRAIAAVLAGSALVAASAQADAPLRRFAVIAGNDDGGSGTRPLIYARDDAKKIYDIMRRLGGINTDDAFLLLNASAEEFLGALSKAERRAREAKGRGERAALFIYYSGHAKDGALLLGKTRLPFESLKARLAQAPADVRVAVFDACRSGTLTRTKGARRAPAFEVESDTAREAKGLVILTSSASDEDSQESDEIGGSYFSHHLASGLLGDADRSGDGRISVGEAYAYAYERTVADTAESAAGAQHPTFSYDLAGNGDLMLTDFAERKEGIVIPAGAPAGPYYLVDTKGFVAAEVLKLADSERRIALAPGSYYVRRRLPDRLRIGEVKVAAGQITTLDERALRDAPFSDDPVKGTLRSEYYARHWSVSVSGTYQTFFDRPPSEGGYFPSTPLLGLEFVSHNFFGRGWSFSGDLMLGGTRDVLNTRLLQGLRYQYSQVALGVSVLHEWPEGTWVPFVGGRLAMAFMTRKFDELQGGPLSDAYYAPSPGLIGGVKWRVSQRFGLTGRARVNYLPYRIDEVKDLAYLELGAMVTYEF